MFTTLLWEALILGNFSKIFLSSRLNLVIHSNMFYKEYSARLGSMVTL